MKKIKLIWDFRGADALKIAEHHVIHLKEYITIKKTNINITGFTALTDHHAIAYMVVTELEMKLIRDTLKPHRGQIYKD
ncbi:hypothetical protein [Aurantibacter sp.]|uniref:hypothetical protein n=1 Tax=Aurantibacter sp. TaxID=2807103 RepID=UPI0035C87AE2